MSEFELKPCPFCGEKAKLENIRTSDGKFSYTVLRVVCWQCGCRTKDFSSDGYYGMSYTKENVAAVWNRRANE